MILKRNGCFCSMRKMRSFFYQLILPVMCVVLFFCSSGCGVHRYTNVELQKKTTVTFPKEYEEIITPLDSVLIPVRKRVFLIKLDIDELKQKLFEAGTNQRVARIDENIDVLRSESSALSTIRREILNTILSIYPAYIEPDVFPYQGEKKSYKEITKRIVIVTQADQQEYKNSKDDEKMSESYDYKTAIRLAMKQFTSLPDSLKPKIHPIGSTGPVPPIKPYDKPRPDFVK
jgi:hypothetical protein